MLDRLAIYGVPLAAGIVTAAVLLGPGGEQEARGVRVRGLVAAGSRNGALQIQSVAHVAGSFRAAPMDPLEVSVSQNGRVIGSWRGSSHDDGFVEALVAFDAPVADGELALAIRGAVTSDAVIAVVPPLAADGPPPAVTVSPGISVRAQRGFAVAEHREPFVISVDADEPPEVKLEADGAEVVLGAPERTCTGERCRFVWTASVTPRALTTTLTLFVDGAERWQGSLPLERGLWLDPDSERTLKIASSGATEMAYVSLFDQGGRLWATRQAMKVDEMGRAHADVALPEDLALDGAVGVMLASDPEASLALSWPLHPERGRVIGKAVELADTMPAAIARERERAFRARLPALVLIAAAALFELLYLWQRWQKSDLKLEALSRQVGRSASALTQRTPLWWLTLAVGGLVLAFGVLAVMTLV